MGGRQGRKALPAGVGEEIFQQVETLTADGKMTRLAAFKAIAGRTGKKVGTVTANYYRVARKRGVPLRARRTRVARRAEAKGTVEAIAAAIRRLESLLRTQVEELAALRRDKLRFEQLRRLFRP